MTTRTRPWRYLAFALVVGAATVLFYLVTSGPVLFSFVEPGSPAQEPAWSLLNPLRNRGPEHAAEALFRQLIDGYPADVLARLQTQPPVSPDVITGEQKARLQSWRLVRRHDFQDRSELLYHVRRTDYPQIVRPVRLSVSRPQGADQWRVTFFSAVY